MGLLARIRVFLAKLFSRDPEESQRRMELRRVVLSLESMHPPYYRGKQDLVLPGFAQSLYEFCTALRPLIEVVMATVANPDIRISQRFYDFLIESKLSTRDQELKHFFTYEGMAERIGKSFNPVEEIDAIAQEFKAFMHSLDELGLASINADLTEADRFIELCTHDYERILGLFDPRANLDDPRYKPDFAAAAGEEVVPELLDLHYLLDGFAFTKPLRENVIKLIERRSTSPVDAAKRAKVDKLFAQLSTMLQERLSTDILLAMIRASKSEPYFTPNAPHEKKDFYDAFRRRLANQYEKDRERLLRELHESVIEEDIKSLFGNMEILPIEGYDEEGDSFLRRESPNGFIWIKPLRILRTFVTNVFDAQFRDIIKRILVEGYFDSKNFQNNLANVLYQCERTAGRISEFEAQLRGNGRESTTMVNRYVEEMRRGRDVSSMLTRVVDSINSKAGSIVEDETSLFVMLGNSLSDIVGDLKKPNPMLITNLRSLGAGRNKELMVHIAAGKDKIATLVKILKNFTYVKTPVSGEAATGEGAPPSRSQEPMVPQTDDDIEELEAASDTSEIE
jgi:hypothetical protein